MKNACLHAHNIFCWSVSLLLRLANASRYAKPFLISHQCVLSAKYDTTKVFTRNRYCSWPTDHVIVSDTHSLRHIIILPIVMLTLSNTIFIVTILTLCVMLDAIGIVDQFLSAMNVGIAYAERRTCWLSFVVSLSTMSCVGWSWCQYMYFH
jgi:hypothetical protein